jgi:hypothetical protein
VPPNPIRPAVVALAPPAPADPDHATHHGGADKGLGRERSGEQRTCTVRLDVGIGHHRTSLAHGGASTRWRRFASAPPITQAGDGVAAGFAITATAPETARAEAEQKPHTRADRAEWRSARAAWLVRGSRAAMA